MRGLHPRRAASRLLMAMCLALAVGTVQPPAASAAVGDPAPLRRTISRAEPLMMIGFYQGGEGPDGTDTVKDTWSALPTDVQANSQLLLIGGHSLKNTAEVRDWITQQADTAQAAGIPFSVQALNGETNTADLIPADFFRTLAKNHPLMQGINAAELYNNSDHSAHLTDLLQVAVDNGLHLIWSDTNINGGGSDPDGRPMIERWLEQNAALLSLLRQHPQNAVFMNKESWGDQDTDALNLGLWLSGIIGNWGVSSDWWHWGLNGYGRLWGSGGQSWKDILQYPEAMTAQSMLRVASQGATVFMAEAQWFNVATDGERLAPFQFALLPLFRDFLADRIHIPTKAEVLQQNKVAYQGNVYNKTVTYDGLSNIFPKTGRYGLVPLVPTTLTSAETAVFDTITKTSRDADWFDQRYPQSYRSSNTFLLHNTRTWYWMNHAENTQFVGKSTFDPTESAASEVGIKAGNHTFAVFGESAGRINVTVNNYRTNKDNVRTATIYGVPPTSGFSQTQTYRYLRDYLSVDLDGNGKPVVDADGNVKTAANLDLNDRSSRDVRTTTITVDGTWKGGAPQVTFAAADESTRPYSKSQAWDASAKRLTITLVHNGLVRFSVQTDGPGGPGLASNLALGKTAAQSSTYTGGDGTGPASRAVDGNTDGDFRKGSVTHTTTQTDPWWRVDLGATYRITGVMLWNRTDYDPSRLANYTVSVLDPSGAVIWSQTRSGQPLPSAVVDVPNVDGSQVKVSLAGANRILSLAEVQVAGVAVPTNIAKDKTATQSSTYSGGDGTGSASKAVDGNTDGAFANGSVSHTNGETDPWWQVDLGSVQTIGEIEVWNRTDYDPSRLSNYTLSILDGAGATVWTSTRPGYPSPAELTSVGAVDGRYVRVSLKGSGRTLSLAEVKVAAATNYAAGKAATQSSTYTGGDGTGPASRAVDGKTDGDFRNGSVSHTNAESNPWWKVDLGADRQIRYVEVWNRTDYDPSRLSDYTIEVLDAAGKVVWSGAQVGHPSPSELVAVGATGRSVRVSLAGSNRILSLAEVRVLG